MNIKQKSAFTLLEVLITLGILLGMVMFVSQLVRYGFDIRYAINDNSKVTHRINAALNRISDDLNHAILLSSKDSVRTQGQKRTIFKIDVKSKGDSLSLTSLNHKSNYANAKEGDQSYVVYELEESKKYPGRKNLMRGETKRVPGDFKSNPNMSIVAANISSLKIETFDGSRWLHNKWDSTARDTADLMPHMVRLSIEAWADDPIEEGSSNDGDNNLVMYNTVVFLPYSLDFNRLKDGPKSFRIYK